MMCAVAPFCVASRTSPNNAEMRGSYVVGGRRLEGGDHRTQAFRRHVREHRLHPDENAGSERIRRACHTPSNSLSPRWTWRQLAALTCIVAGRIQGAPAGWLL